MSKHPRVSIGLPVFNGENFLSEALDSILAQTYPDFELIISDNGSVDATEEICRSYIANDDRVKYYRNDRNRGAAWNYNRVFYLSTGEYFKWAAHDDLCGPEFLESCTRVLDHDPGIILCYTRTLAIDEKGNVVSSYAIKPKAGSPKPAERFYEFVCVPHPCVAVFGLIRSSILAKTSLIGDYAASDRPLLGELSLLGRFHEIPEPMFFYRNHSQQSWQLYSTEQAQEEWYDPRRVKKKTFPHWRLFREHFRSINRVPLPWQERMWCYLYMGWWLRRKWRVLAKDLL